MKKERIFEILTIVGMFSFVCPVLVIALLIGAIGLNKYSTDNERV